MKILLLRHGLTKGNLERRYVGTTDEPLCQAGIEDLTRKFHSYLGGQSKTGLREQEIRKFFCEAGRQQELPFFVSPMLRCRQTMELLLPQLEERFGLSSSKIVIENRLKEMDFGKFEYKNYEELKNNKEYERFLKTNGNSGFPEGEAVEAFKERCILGYEAVVRQLLADRYEFAVGVVHGGTIMAIMEAKAVPGRTYFEWQVENGKGFVLEVEKI